MSRLLAFFSTTFNTRQNNGMIFATLLVSHAHFMYYLEYDLCIIICVFVVIP